MIGWIEIFCITILLYIGAGIVSYQILVKKQKTSKKAERLITVIDDVWQEETLSTHQKKTIYRLSKRLRRQVDKEYLYEALRARKIEESGKTQNFIIESRILQPHLQNKNKNLFNSLFIIKCIGKFELTPYKNEMLELIRSPLKQSQEYIEANIIKTLCSFGDVDACTAAVESLKEKKSLLSDTFLVDCLRGFKGDEEMLRSNMLEALRNHNQMTEKVYLAYFSSIGWERAAVDMLYLLRENIEQEKKVLVLKYFTEVKYEPAKVELMRILREGSQDEKILAASALAHYSEEEVISRLQESLEDEDFRVREQAAKSIYGLLCQNEELFEILAEQEIEIVALVDKITSDEEGLMSYWKQMEGAEQET